MLLNISTNKVKTWSEKQIHEAYVRFGGVEDLPLPLFDTNEATYDQIDEYSVKVVQKIREAQPAAVHIDGHIGLVVAVVALLKERGMPCFYAVFDANHEFLHFNPYFYTLKIHSTAPIILNEEQEKMLNELEDFIKNEQQNDVFLLFEYLISRKKAIIQHVVHWCRKNHKKVAVLATTAKGAADLSNAIGVEVLTIQDFLFEFAEFKSEGHRTFNTKKYTISYRQKLYVNAYDVVIVDDASNLGFQKPLGHVTASYNFNEGLLQDLIMKVSEAKLLMIGDNFFLPPHQNLSFSPAISPQFFNKTANKKVSIGRFNYTSIQKEVLPNPIFTIIKSLRNSLRHGQFEKMPKFPSQGFGSYDVYSEDDFFAQFIATYRSAPHQTMMIGFRNKDILSNNLRIREALGRKGVIDVGDTMLVVQNSSIAPFYNGDLITIVSIERIENEEGQLFIHAIVKNQEAQEYKTVLFGDLIYHESQNISHHMYQQLLFSFEKLMRSVGIAQKTKLFQEQLRKEVHLNAVRVKFGYCINVHKAQHSEWNNLFVQLDKKVFQMPNHIKYRWLYTVFSRCRKKLVLNQGPWIE